MNCNQEEAYSLATEVAGMWGDEKNNDAVVILSPPFVFLSGVRQLLKGTEIKIAAQNCSGESQGAFTGEVAASMLQSIGTEYVIIGHSERRLYFKESPEELVKKVNSAMGNGLIPIFCVGESLPQREADEQEKIVTSQLSDGLFHLEQKDFEKIIIAYEPVWAIGTGKTATSAQAQEMHSFIRNEIAKKYNDDVAGNLSILYGGSCNEKNAGELFSMPDVDGGLIGGASLKSRSFVNIAKSF